MKKRSKNKYLGKWRIKEMEAWDKDYIDLEVPGHITFSDGNIGDFQFGLVQGDIDYRIETYEETERIEFSWAGADEMDPASGRGLATIKDGELHGRIYIHLGDDSWFVCVRR